jgi:hypothetical protein
MMWSSWRVLSSSFVLCVFGGVAAAAQDHPDIANPSVAVSVVEASSDTAHSTPTIDVGDLWHLVHHPDATGSHGGRSSQRYVVFAPSIGAKPTTGFTGGFSNNVAFFAGDAATTHISTFTDGLKVSQKKQVMVGGRLALFTANDSWFVLGDSRMAWTSHNTYALGADAPASSGTNLKLDVLKLYESAYRKIGPGLFVGGGLNLNSHFNVGPGATTGTAAWNNSAYAEYNASHGFSSAHQNSSGAGVGFRYDTRDNGINPDGGALASATYRAFFDKFLGGDSTWQELALDVRTYRKITPDARQKLAFWFLGDVVTGGTAPFLDLPAIGADGRSARGYGEGRYRGEHLLYWEAEYRATLTGNGLLGMVVFANATTIGSAETGERLFQSFAPGAGVGLRVLLNKRSRTNLCADWGWGKQGSRGFYLSIQEAF